MSEVTAMLAVIAATYRNGAGAELSLQPSQPGYAQVEPIAAVALTVPRRS
ncbi:hypothetical protein [Pseudomonas sp. LR_7]